MAELPAHLGFFPSKPRRGRPLVEATLAIDVRQLKREGAISGAPGAIWVDGEYLAIVGVEQHFGGQRPLFVCPICHARACILFRRPTYACRRCHGLAYAVEFETRHARLLRRAIKLRTRLGQTDGGVVASYPSRPRGMWWHSFLRIRRLSDPVERQIAWSLARKFGLR